MSRLIGGPDCVVIVGGFQGAEVEIADVNGLFRIKAAALAAFEAGEVRRWFVHKLLTFTKDHVAMRRRLPWVRGISSHLFLPHFTGSRRLHASGQIWHLVPCEESFRLPLKRLPYDVIGPVPQSLLMKVDARIGGICWPVWEIGLGMRGLDGGEDERRWGEIGLGGGGNALTGIGFRSREARKKGVQKREMQSRAPMCRCARSRRKFACVLECA